jgi:hypothetical protein
MLAIEDVVDVAAGNDVMVSRPAELAELLVASPSPGS